MRPIALYPPKKKLILVTPMYYNIMLSYGHIIKTVFASFAVRSQSASSYITPAC